MKLLHSPKSLLSTSILLAAAFLFFTAGRWPQHPHSLQQAFQKDFLIGTAVNAAQIEKKDAKATQLIAEQFSALTPENIMKAEIIHPEWNRYQFDLADRLVSLAAQNGQQVNGHTLIWHSQLPLFAKQLKDPDSFRTFFQDHIRTIAGRYNKKILSWDVVNEALNEDGSMRITPFYQKIGPDYVTEAFRLAQQAAPSTELYYNDYNNEQPAKRAGCLLLIKKIKEAGVRIDGVGIQGHWHLGKIPLHDIEESILAYHALGLKVMITELDIEMLQRNFQGADVSQRVAANPALNPYANGIPDSLLQQQARDYASLFQLFLKHRDKVSRVTFWGVNDGQSWLNGWPIPGRTNYPLLFDRAFQPKPAYHAVLALKQ